MKSFPHEATAALFSPCCASLAWVGVFFLSFFLCGYGLRFILFRFFEGKYTQVNVRTLYDIHDPTGISTLLRLAIYDSLSDRKAVDEIRKGLSNSRKF